MKRKNFRPKKRLGQNFLYDPAIAERIVSGVSLGPDDIVVELGAGRGILTRAIATTGARVIAVEVDPPLYESLKAHFDADEEARVEMLHADLSDISLRDVLEERGLTACVLMGNIPYNLTRDVLFDYLVEAHGLIEKASIMVQKEVGDRIASPPGSRVYGITSVVLQTLYEVRVALRVAPGSFHPPPKVASVVLDFRARPERLLEDGELSPFVTMVRNVFQQRRKTLSNSLRSSYELPDDGLDRIRAATQIDLGLRPEALDNESFITLSRALAEVLAK